MAAIVYSRSVMRLPPPALDRTTLIVRLGLVLLAITGVLAIFGESLWLSPILAGRN